MRVPTPITIASCIAVILITWWIGTRGKDFMTPPDASTLATIHSEVEQSMPAADQPRDAVSAPRLTPQTAPDYIPKHRFARPVIDSEDIHKPPSLDEYMDERKKGPAYLIDLAQLLEQNNLRQRSLIAWERVMDASHPNDQEWQHTLAAILRLKDKTPLWNTDPEQQIPITLYAGAGASTAKIIEPVLKELTNELQHASSGILKVSLQVIAGDENMNTNGPAPVALWLTGKSDSSQSTEILSFSVNNPADIKTDASATIYQLIRGSLLKTDKLTPPRQLGETPPLQAIRTQITRRTWKIFGDWLNQQP